MGRICAMVGCSNSTFKLDDWYAGLCEKHGVRLGGCVCQPPFVLFPFPSEKKNPEGRRRWNKLVNRKTKSGKNWEANYQDRICSIHFKDGEPTDAWPDPTENTGYERATKRPRNPPKKRLPYSKVMEDIKASKKRKKEVPDATQRDAEIPVSDQAAEDVQAEFELKDDCLQDHDYIQPGTTAKPCPSCCEKNLEILKLKSAVQKLKNKSKKMHYDMTKVVLKTDKTVKQFTGIESKDKFECLHSYLEPRVTKMAYWRGAKKSPRASPRGKATPEKPGPARHLNSREEFILVLLKIRLALNLAFLSGLFSVSVGTASHVFNTWIKFLARELGNLIFWPDKHSIIATIPKSLKYKYRNLRCTIDCTEVFIERPRNLFNQAATWSDYKKHNTVKILVAIAPNGMISFLSKAWGGRTSDVHLTKESGFLDLVEPGDIILADRGFTIKEELLLRHASLEIPPPSKGKEQHTPKEVAKTKKIANARIHVERAIGRMKWFSILSQTLPISLVPLIDDIVIVCAALSNLRSPLVK